MPNHLSKFVTNFLVISDTAMSDGKDGVYAFGPVVKELESLQFPNKITWIGFRKKNNDSFVKINDKRIHTVALPASGGKSFFDKIMILVYYPMYFFIILNQCCKADKIHVRAPSNPAVIAMLLSYLFPGKRFWFKYAGNWKGKASPFYKFQRNLLAKLGDNSKITVNGTWDNQPKNVYGFENPCLDDKDRKSGELICKTKQLTEKINYCFVGGMNENKGVEKIINVLETLEIEKIGTFHFVGGGPLLEQIKKRASKINCTTKFHGFLAKDEVVKVYNESQFIVLPSESEGFPKVIGEAMNYGCVPIVSKISCIDQYIKDGENGFLIYPINQTAIANIFKKSFCIDKKKYQQIIRENYLLAEKFTYNYYEQQITTKIFTS